MAPPLDYLPINFVMCTIWGWITVRGPERALGPTRSGVTDRRVWCCLSAELRTQPAGSEDAIGELDVSAPL